eukprot:8557673-Pyramimonas_sp.AAC.1
MACSLYPRVPLVTFIPLWIAHLPSTQNCKGHRPFCPYLQAVPPLTFMYGTIMGQKMHASSIPLARC